MESFATLIKSRKSTRKFTDQLLNPEQVENFKEEAEEEIQLKLDI